MSAVSCIAASDCEPPPDTRSSVSGTLLRLDALGAVAQRVGQAFEDRAVDVGARVRVAEADDRALRVGPGVRMPGVQYGCSIRPWSPAARRRTSASNKASGATPSARAAATSGRRTAP